MIAYKNKINFYFLPLSSKFVSNAPVEFDQCTNFLLKKVSFYDYLHLRS